MELSFLGTGSAWGVPEYGCHCAICRNMQARGEYRKRSSLLVSTGEKILVDCGPDMRRQMWQYRLPRPDAVLITHEHADHYLGLDELLSYRRCTLKDQWVPIPVYATAQTWVAVEARFGYLLGSTLEKRLALPGQPLQGLRTPVVPFKTYHGPIPTGAVGYVIRYGEKLDKTMAYTSDLVKVLKHEELLYQADIMVIQSNWFNEPQVNRPHHLSFQRGLELLAKWKPRGQVYLTHISDQDWIQGDAENHLPKKIPPLSPLSDPRNGRPYPVPTCQKEWDSTVEKVVKDRGLSFNIRAAYDGLKLSL